MAASTVLVGQINGQAWIRNAEGELVPLRAGMRIPQDSEIVTAAGATVELLAEGRQALVVGGGRDIALAPELFVEDLSPDFHSIQDLTDADAARVIAALEAGLDPFAQLEAPVATNAPASGGDGHAGGASYTRVLEAIETITPLNLSYGPYAVGVEDPDQFALADDAPIGALNAQPGAGEEGTGTDTGEESAAVEQVLDGADEEMTEPAPEPQAEPQPEPEAGAGDGADGNESDVEEPVGPGDGGGEEPEAPGTEPEEPQVEPEAPGTEPEEPGVEPEEPEVALGQGAEGDDVLTGSAEHDLMFGDKAPASVDDGNIAPPQAIALVVDTSASMLRNLDGEETKAEGEQRLTLLKASLHKFVDTLSVHNGEVTLHLIDFSEKVNGKKTFTLHGVDHEAQLSSLRSAIDNLTAEGATNYQAAFKAATDWFQGLEADVEVVRSTFFLTDGNPTTHNGSRKINDGSHTDFDDVSHAVDAFNALLNASGGKVHAVGFGDDVNSDYLRYFDTGGGSVGDKAVLLQAAEKQVIARADLFEGVENATLVDEGTLHVAIAAGSGQAVTVESRPFAVSLAGGESAAVLSFKYKSSYLGKGSGSSVSWHVEKKAGENTWLKVEASAGRFATSSSDTVLETGPIAESGEYRLVITVENHNSQDGAALLREFRLTEYKAFEAPAGEPVIVNAADDLTGALQELLKVEGIGAGSEYGNDEIRGGAGNDVLFGDAPPATLAALLEGDAAVDAESLYRSIKDDPAAHDASGVSAGGDDMLDGGEGDDILFGQGGNDTLIGGAGDDILFGGAGDDVFVWNRGHEGEPDAPAVDRVMDFGEKGSDTLDIGDLLSDADRSNLDDYLSVDDEAGKTVINVSSKGGGAGGIDQKIVLENVDFDEDKARQIADSLKNDGSVSSSDIG